MIRRATRPVRTRSNRDATDNADQRDGISPPPSGPSDDAEDEHPVRARGNRAVGRMRPVRSTSSRARRERWRRVPPAAITAVARRSRPNITRSRSTPEMRMPSVPRRSRIPPRCLRLRPFVLGKTLVMVDRVPASRWPHRDHHRPQADQLVGCRRPADSADATPKSVTPAISFRARP